MKTIKILLIFFAAFLVTIPNIKANSEEIDLYLFYSETCPHCKNEKKRLAELEEKYNLKIYYYEINNEQNSLIMDKVKEAFGINEPYVPFTTIGTVSFIGYNENIGDQIEDAIIYYSKNKMNNITKQVLDGTFIVGFNRFEVDEIETEKINVPVIGKINPRAVSLPLIAAVIGAIDGFNPCAMWVLLFLIGMLIGMKDKGKMWVLGLTFLSTSALVYMLLMVSWLSISVSMMQITLVRSLIALFAIGAGLWNVSKYMKTRKQDDGCEIVSKDDRKKTFEKIKKITNEKNLILAMIGVAALAISVNIVELACSAGLPLMFTQILAVNNLPAGEYGIYILIYILFFLIDDIIIFAIAMKSFEVIGLSNKYTKYSTLIGGLIMVIIGLLLMFAPNILMFA